MVGSQYILNHIFFCRMVRLVKVVGHQCVLFVSLVFHHSNSHFSFGFTNVLHFKVGASEHSNKVSGYAMASKFCSVPVMCVWALNTVNPLYNDIGYNSKIRYNANLVCTKISGSCIFSFTVPCYSLGKHMFLIFERIASQRQF